MSPGHFAPGGSAHATIGFASCLPQLSMQPLALPGTAVLRPRPRGAAPDLSIGITEVLVTAQDIVPRAEDLHAGRKKGSNVPLAPLGPTRATRLAPCLGPPRRPMGTVTIGQPGGFVPAEPDGGHGSPPGKMMLALKQQEISL
jgi:hypothetical protein